MKWCWNKFKLRKLTVNCDNTGLICLYVSSRCRRILHFFEKKRHFFAFFKTFVIFFCVDPIQKINAHSFLQFCFKFNKMS